VGNRLPLIVSVVLGAIAVGLIVLWANRYQSQFLEKEVTKIIVVNQDLPEGEILAETDLATKDVPDRYLPNKHILPDDVELVIGQVITNPLSAGKPVLWTDLGIMEKEVLSDVIKDGERAITIPVNEMAGVGGLIKARDHVDILGTFDTQEYLKSAGGVRDTNLPPGLSEMMGSGVKIDTATITLLQNVTVLATGQHMTEELNVIGMAELMRRSKGYGSVTLLVTPEEAQMLVFCIQRGELVLSLRNSQDFTIVTDLEKMTDENVLNQIWPKKLTEQRQRRIRIIEQGVEVGTN